LTESDMDFSKLPMSIQEPEYVAKVGLDALGNKPVVIPGFKNNMMVKMTNMMPLKVAINMGAKMVEKVIDPSLL
jgi:short-subunit dehydrogenase